MVKLWSISGREIETLQKANYSLDIDKQSIKNKINFSDDGNFIDFVTTYKEDNSRKYIIKIWNKNGILLKSVEKVNRTITIDEINFSPDGKTFTIPNKDYALKKWGINGKILASLTGHTSNINRVSFGANGKIVASASDDKTVKIWGSNGELVYSLHHSYKVNSLDFSSDGKMIASAGNDKTVKIWSGNGKFLYSLNHNDKVNSAIFSSDSKIIASASDDKTVKIWSINGKLLHTLSHDDKIKTVKFSPDNKIIATISDSNTVKLWSTIDGKEKQLLFKGGDLPISLSFSADNKILAIVETGRTRTSLILYFIDSFWYQNTTLYSGNDFTSEISFSPDGQKLAVGTYNNDKNVIVLSLNIDELLIQGCSRVRDYLQNNPNVKESDRHLCDDVPKELPPAKEK
jgi:WD40 repeat protein